MKRIPYQTRYLSDRGIPLKASVYDDDGKITWETPPDTSAPIGTIERQGTPKQVVADTYALLDEVFMSLAGLSALHKDDDSRRVMGWRNAIDEARERLAVAEELPAVAGEMRLGNESYKYLFEMFKRTLPLGNDAESVKLAKENGITAQTFSWALWRNSEAAILNSLRAQDDPERTASWADKDI